MKIKKVSLIVVVGGLLFLGLLILSERKAISIEYPDYSNLKFYGGWIPHWIPQSTYDIKLAYIPNSSSVFIKAKIKNKLVLSHDCRLINKDHLLPHINTKATYPDWVYDFLNSLKVKNNKYKYYLCGKEIIKQRMLLIDELNNELYIYN